MRPTIKGNTPRDLMDAYPAKWQEFLQLESQLCSAHGPYLDPREREHAEHQLDTLCRFFRFDAAHK